MNDLVRSLRCFTAARIGLKAAGQSLATQEALSLARDHALARDAIHVAFDAVAVRTQLAALEHPVHEVHSRAVDRATYLRRPDLGRLLAPEMAAHLGVDHAVTDIAVVVADGLAAAAANTHAVPLLLALRELAPQRWCGTPVVLARGARVALGDAIGAALNSRVVLVLIGERPGMSAHDSLGAYLTFAPRPGRTDAERNCVSNIRPAGLDYLYAARQIHWLVEAALARGITGVELKDESAADLRIAPAPANIRP